MKLYGYFRSSASYRVRIALNLKGLGYESIPVHLVRSGGEQLSPEYRQISADGLVPALVDETAGSGAITQSLAIIEYLEEAYGGPALLPTSPQDRAYVRSIALSIACDVHPLNNLRVLRYLVRDLHVSEADKDAWYRHWCEQGLASIEATLARDDRARRFCYGDTPTLADCCLIPQVFNARRLGCDLSAMPTVQRINNLCETLDPFKRAAPAAQADAE
ncbi:MAG: maleylacetoacetate isomerase [Herminiimonas sp.]|nr:maleylacetoacetate isomerase [Herminiimonas sp.]